MKVTDNPDRAALIALWDRAFLNYTPTAPDHWLDPLQESDAFFDDPAVAVPILLKIGDRDRQQAYIEYFAAVWRQHFADQPERLKIALPFLQQAAEKWDDRKNDLQQLIQAVETTLRQAEDGTENTAGGLHGRS